MNTTGKNETFVARVRPSQGFTKPYGFVYPRYVGVHYAIKAPSYPIISTPTQLYTKNCSYLNAVANRPDHPLHFMAFDNLRRV
jgi:hypothetical protein